jgi:hypothetical protein
MMSKQQKLLTYSLFFIALFLLFAPKETQDTLLSKFNITLKIQNKQIIAVVCILIIYYYYNNEKLF